MFETTNNKSNSNLEIPKFKNHMLFLGAGFSASAGGFLATQMWEQIFFNNKVRSIDKLRNRIKDPQHNFDYESIVHSVVDGDNFSNDEKNILIDALNSAFVRHNMQIQGTDIINKINFKWLRAFLKSFSGDNNLQGTIFTTNQDIFVENLCRGLPANIFPSYVKSCAPDKKDSPQILNLPVLNEYPYGKGDKVIIPDSTDGISTALNGYWAKPPFLHYIKLHGSWGWKYSSENNHHLITGINKIEKINKTPLLKYYWGLFQRATSQRSMKILIVGYAFNDPHINDEFVKAIQNGSSIFVINPSRPKDFFDSLKRNTKHAIEIWNGVYGYYPYRLEELFPSHEEQVKSSLPIMSLKQDFDFNYNDF